MCRWIAYRGEIIPLEQYVTAPAHSLVVQSLKALESTASTNGGTTSPTERTAWQRAVRVIEG